MKRSYSSDSVESEDMESRLEKAANATAARREAQSLQHGHWHPNMKSNDSDSDDAAVSGSLVVKLAYDPSQRRWQEADNSDSNDAETQFKTRTITMWGIPREAMLGVPLSIGQREFSSLIHILLDIDAAGEYYLNGHDGPRLFQSIAATEDTDDRGEWRFSFFEEDTRTAFDILMADFPMYWKLVKAKRDVPMPENFPLPEPCIMRERHLKAAFNGEEFLGSNSGHNSLQANPGLSGYSSSHANFVPPSAPLTDSTPASAFGASVRADGAHGLNQQQKDDSDDDSSKEDGKQAKDDAPADDDAQTGSAATGNGSDITAATWDDIEVSAGATNFVKKVANNPKAREKAEMTRIKTIKGIETALVSVADLKKICSKLKVQRIRNKGKKEILDAMVAGKV